MAAPAKKVLPFAFRVCNQDQQACRPSGKLRFKDDAQKAAGLIHGGLSVDDPLASDISNLSPAEMAIFKMRTQEFMAISGQGRFPNLTPAQVRMKRCLTAVCGDICLIQLTPLRVLRVKIVALLSRPEIAKCNFKKVAVGRTSAGTMAAQTMPEVIKTQIERIIKGISLLEKFVGAGRQEGYSLAKDLIDDAMIALKSTEIELPAFKQALELVEHLQVCLADQQNLFPLLLAPLGSIAFKQFELNPALCAFSNDALGDLHVCTGFFRTDVRDVHRSMREHLSKADVPQKGSLKQALCDVDAVVEELCGALEREAVSLLRSPEMAILRKHFQDLLEGSFNTAEITKIRQVFAAYFARAELLNKIYTTGLQRFNATTQVVEDRIKAMPSENPAVQEMRTMIGCYFFFDFYIRDFSHIFRITALPYYTEQDRYGVMGRCFDNIQSLTLRRPFDSQFVTNADLIFLAIQQQIAVLDRLSRDPIHQHGVYNLFIHSAALMRNLEEAFLTLQKKGAVVSPKDPIDEFQKELAVCIAICQGHAQQSPCKGQAAFIDALRRIQALLQSLTELPLSEGLFDATTRVVASFSFMPIGNSIDFSGELREYFTSVRPLCGAYAVQMEDLALDLEARTGPLLAPVPKRLRKPVKNMIQQVTALLTSFKRVAQSLPSLQNEKEAFQGAMALLDWLQKMESVDVSVWEEACGDIMVFVDRSDAFPEPAQFKASLAQFQSDFGDVIQNVMSLIVQLHRPLFSWSRVVILDDASAIEPRQQAVVEEVVEDEDHVEEAGDAKASADIPADRPVLASRRVQRSARSFAEIEPQISRLIFALSKLQHQEPARTEVMSHALSELTTQALTVREEFLCDQAPACPFTHAAALYSASALMAEQALKFLLVHHIPDSLQPYEALLASHDLSRLLHTVLEIRPQLAQTIHPDALEMMADVQGICLTGRYLEDGYGSEAVVLKRMARLAAAKKSADLRQAEAIDRDMLQLMRTGKRQVLQLLTVIADLLPDSDAVAPVEQPKLFPVVVRDDAHRHLFKAVETLGVLRRRTEVGHFASQRPLLYGNTAGNACHDQMRNRQIVRSLNNMQHYFLALNELLRAASTPHTCYSKTNGLLLNTSLLLEQACLSIIAYLDIPSDSSPLHVLFETVNPQGRPRPRAFDHNIGNLFGIIQRYAAQTDRLPPFVFTAEEVGMISLLNQFIGVTSRYLSTANGEIAVAMRELRDLSELLYVVETGFRTEPQEAALKARFGNHEPEWRGKILAAIVAIQEGRVFPVVAQALKIAEKLMQFNLDLRHSRPVPASGSVTEEDGKQ